ncbi:hypothetical protein PRK78_006979 [Emydomyces testavorans]|uniref:C2H2-type domain-containing protein n=1 Tax=Emydomyces testavorans TaxID=2070801 RepID=A0AAF0DNF1_9EURO|nr:hypothetical protein PRK78_006979 [Emydomyces testavorans]
MADGKKPNTRRHFKGGPTAQPPTEQTFPPVLILKTPFDCPYCPKKFINRHAVQQHKLEKHKDSVVKDAFKGPGGAKHKPKPEHTGNGNPVDASAGKATTAAIERWAKIPDHEHGDLLNLLSQHCHSLDELPKSYRLEEYNQQEIDGYGRCKKCNGNDSKGCVTSPRHDFASPHKEFAARLQKTLITPLCQNSHIPKRAAIALDCEMVGTFEGDHPVCLSAVDYLTGEVLINCLIQPLIRVTDWRSRFTGLTPKKMALAAADATTLQGWEAARARLWEYMNPQTILIGQNLANDLKALGMVHTRIVDSEVLTRKAVGVNCKRVWGLKNLCDAFLGIKIQGGKNGHSSLEDAFAVREVVLWCIKNPEKLVTWGEKRRAEIAEERAKAERAKREARQRALEAEVNAAREEAKLREAFRKANERKKETLIIEISESEESEDGFGSGDDEE